MMLSKLFAAQVINFSPLPHQSGVGAKEIQTILTIVFTTTGAVAVLMVIIGGIKYASSQGEPQSTAKAKNTIIYAVVGLVISIFAVAIVDFVIGHIL